MRRPRITLKQLMSLVTVACITFAGIGELLYQHRQLERIESAFWKLHGREIYCEQRALPWPAVACDLDLSEQPSLPEDGLRSFEGLPVRSINFRGSSLTDRGLEHLARVPRLSEINVTGTSVTDHGINQLHKALPNLRIVRKSG